MVFDGRFPLMESVLDHERCSANAWAVAHLPVGMLAPRLLVLHLWPVPPNHHHVISPVVAWHDARPCTSSEQSPRIDVPGQTCTVG